MVDIAWLIGYTLMGLILANLLEIMITVRIGKLRKTKQYFMRWDRRMLNGSLQFASEL